MDNKEIYDRLSNCQTDGAQFVVFSVDGDTCYFGKDHLNNKSYQNKDIKIQNCNLFEFIKAIPVNIQNDNGKNSV